MPLFEVPNIHKGPAVFRAGECQCGPCPKCQRLLERSLLVLRLQGLHGRLRLGRAGSLLEVRAVTSAVLKTARAFDRALADEQALIERILAKLGVRRRRRREKYPRRFWTAAEDREIRRRYPDSPTPALAHGLNRSIHALYLRARQIGVHKSPAFLSETSHLREFGVAYRYPKGHIPANKGLRRPGFAPGRMAETQFKKETLNGAARQKWVPIGTEVRDPDGYLKRKISDDRSKESRFNWRYVHVLTWEEKHGPVPPGHAVVFKNGDKTDVREENLELITRRELMARNTVHNLPKPLAEIVQLRARLVRQIRKRQSA